MRVLIAIPGLFVLALAVYVGGTPSILAGVVVAAPLLSPLFAGRSRRSPAPSVDATVRAAYAFGRVERERELLAERLAGFDPLPRSSTRCDPTLTTTATPIRPGPPGKSLPAS